MKKKLTALIATIILMPLLFSSFYNPDDTDEYIIIGWNDLGMHCANKDFNSVVILPPYNNLRSQVILKGNSTQNPQIVTSGVNVSYEVPGNTYSVGKTNFWDYEYDLFGVNLPDNIGLTGAGLNGTMTYSSGHYSVDGVPVTPYTDSDTQNEDPFQLALFTLTDLNGNQLATTQNVIPVSGEIGCVSSGCHSSEQDILDEHEDEGGFDPTNLPILCAECHADFALGTTGHPGLPSLSEAIHDKHKDKTNDCYKCHPGQDAQCFRGAMHAAGMVCQDCHGDMEEVAESIKNGRRPWQDEPSCGTTACHGPTYATEPGKLFKDSKGHGGLYCSACHGSPHADLPSTNPRDNVQNIALQGYAGTLNSCTVCHGYNPTGAGPHGIMAPGPSTDATLSNLSVNGVTINGFSPQTFSYTYEVPMGTNDVPLVDATATDANASVTVTPAVSIPGTTQIFVMAEDNNTNLTYSVEFIFQAVETVELEEHFESGVPSDYFSGNLNLVSGKWYGKYVKRQGTGYSGKGVNLKKEVDSYLQTPSVSSAGELSFYYKGDEDNTYQFKVQKKAPGGSWVTIDQVNYNDNSWKLYSKSINDGTDGLKIRIYKTKSQKSNLLIDELLLTGYQQQTEPMVLEIEDYSKFESIVNFNIYAYSSTIYINTTKIATSHAKVDVYDLIGRRVYQADLSENGTTLINGLKQGSFYIVNINLDGLNCVKKVFLN